MLLFIFRVLFWVILIAFMIASVSSTEIASAAGSNRANFNGVVLVGFGLGVFVFLLDVLTPRRKLGALAGVFFGLLVRGSIPEALAATAETLLSHLSLLFVPAGVGVMLHVELIGAELLPIAASLIISTLLTIVVTALVMRLLGRRGDPR